MINMEIIVSPVVDLSMHQKSGLLSWRKNDHRRVRILYMYDATKPVRQH